MFDHGGEESMRSTLAREYWECLMRGEVYFPSIM